MKFILSLLSVALLLTSCGSETTKPTQDPAYDYVEIEECIIPVLKEIKMKYTKVDGGRGSFNFIESDGKKIRTYHVVISKSYSSVKKKYIARKQDIEQSKITKIIFEKVTDKFNVIGWEAIDTPSLSKFVTYEFFGINTMISMNEYGEKIKQKKDLDYLLNYCKKTWKLNKGEKNASTPK